MSKKCYGYRDTLTRILDRISNINGLDAAGNVIENFDYPINLMFASSMPLFTGSFEDVITAINTGR